MGFGRRARTLTPTGKAGVAGLSIVKLGGYVRERVCSLRNAGAVDWQGSTVRAFRTRLQLISQGSDEGGTMRGRKTTPRARMAALLAALATIGAIAAYAVATASAQGRTLVGEFGFDASAASGTSYYHHCGPPANAGFRIVLTEDGQPVTSLRPGTYWLTV